MKTQCCVADAGCIAKERLGTVGCVLAGSRIALERTRASRRISNAGRVAR